MYVSSMDINALMQDRGISSADTLEIPQSCTKSSIILPDYVSYQKMCQAATV